MTKPPVFDIDPEAFWHDPYPTLAEMRSQAPICFVPQLNATLLTKRDDIFTCEKMIDVFSSDQPGGLMTVLMGENMMRKDGDPHLAERKQAFPALSPRTVRDVWKQKFIDDTNAILDNLAQQSKCDLVKDFALPVSGNALRHITGLTNLTPQEMDQVSQGMIDGVGNYAGDPKIEQRCHWATEKIDAAIDERLSTIEISTDTSMIGVLTRAEQPMDSLRANVKLAISGGQNEPRDAIAGSVYALLANPEQLKLVQNGNATWMQVFEEYARWMSPIGMSPRRIAKNFIWNEVEFEPESRAFLMFGSANHDETHFKDPTRFDVLRNTAKAVSFGAGPHFCAGAAASRSLIADVALPLLFDRFPNMSLAGDVKFGGWAFRGPLEVPVQLDRAAP